MKKSLLNIIKILLLLAAFIYALWIFLPYREVGKFAMSLAHKQLNARGMRLNWSDVSGESDGFTVSNLALNGTVNLSLSSITIRPRILASILSLAAVCDISFKGGNLRLGAIYNFGDGRFLLTAGRNEILLEQLRTNGDFAINGYITFSPANMRIGRANAQLNVPDEFANNLNMLRNFLPLVQEGGRWYLRRN